MTAFKIILIYMSRVVRKETLQIFQLGPKIRSKNSDFVSLNRFSLYQASTINLDRKDSVKISVEL